MEYIGLAFYVAIAAPAVCLADERVYPVDGDGDEKGAVFVADHEAHALFKVTDRGLEVVAKGEGRPRTPLYGIRHITPLSDRGFIASDPATMKLYRIDAGGNVVAVADDGGFVTPWGIAVDSWGDILAVDRVAHRLRRVTSSGEVKEVADVRAPRAVLFGKDGRSSSLPTRTSCGLRRARRRLSPLRHLSSFLTTRCSTPAEITT